MAEYSDEELLNLYRTGDNPAYAFNLLMRKYQENIYYFVRRMVIDHDDADDVVQNVFIKIWKNLENFRQDSALFTWIYRIAVNEAISFLKSKRIRAMVSLSSLEASMLRSLRQDHEFTGDHIQQKLMQAIVRLPDKQRTVFNMRYFDELSYEQMSDILGTSVGALKASYHHAVRKISEFVTTH
jgi:RNA polymerase sigma-70 factor (ECF subfamily)